MLEREILELPPHARHTEPVRERSVKIARFCRNALLSVSRKELERPHVVKSIGELDQNDARVLCNRQQELAVILYLALLRGIQRQVADLGQTIDYLGDLLTELRFDVVDSDVGVFDDVVNQPAGDGGRI